MLIAASGDCDYSVDFTYSATVGPMKYSTLYTLYAIQGVH